MFNYGKTSASSFKVMLFCGVTSSKAPYEVLVEAKQLDLTVPVPLLSPLRTTATKTKARFDV